MLCIAVKCNQPGDAIVVIVRSTNLGLLEREIEYGLKSHMFSMMGVQPLAMCY
jgi:hypothetical protein